MLVEEPDRLYGLAGSAEKYLQLLRSVASSYALSTSLRNRMRLSPWFLSSRRIAAVNSTSLLDAESDDEDESVLQFKLVKPTDSVIVDDQQSAMIFADSILACPQEDGLEKLAESLGAKRLSQLVSERYSIVGEMSESRRTIDLRRGSSTTSLAVHDN